MSSTFNPIEIKSFTALHDDVVISDMVFSERKTGAGIVVLGDDAKLHGVRPRWGKVYAVGPDQKDVAVGQWICVSHGRWTRGANIIDATGEHTIRKVDIKDILAVSDVEPIDENMGIPLTSEQQNGAPQF